MSMEKLTQYFQIPTLWNDEGSSDLTIDIGNRHRFKVHKKILSSKSARFARDLNNSEQDHELIFDENIDPNTFVCMLQLCYAGGHNPNLDPSCLSEEERKSTLQLHVDVCQLGAVFEVANIEDTVAPKFEKVAQSMIKKRELIGLGSTINRIHDIDCFEDQGPLRKAAAASLKLCLKQHDTMNSVYMFDLLLDISPKATQKLYDEYITLERKLEAPKFWKCPSCTTIVRYHHPRTPVSCPCCTADKWADNPKLLRTVPYTTDELPAAIDIGIEITMWKCGGCRNIWQCGNKQMRRDTLFRCPACYRMSFAADFREAQAESDEDIGWSCSICKSVWRTDAVQYERMGDMPKCICCPLEDGI
ncbi:hypothetical protein BDV96DRAFT_647656 [Lophiotrema nucula]|uniref:BTB domain-containing protein n=1 Tax=Lophiotrema nucula TaxID=690887 RepID=A0A6A5Z703_9PLEO|nr:hypothetical protein BDV96DRAFT_647656 [Lophiotrema nucula]